MFSFLIWHHEGDYPDNPRGVGATSVLVTNKALTFHWVGYGVKLHIPQNALPTGLKECRLLITVGLSGQLNQFTLPQNTSLVSEVYWLDSEPRCKFSKPFIVEMQHCMKPTYTSSLNFVHAKCSQTDLPYVFNTVEGGLFPRFSRYGCVQLTDCFSQLLGVVFNGVEIIYSPMVVAEAAPFQYHASLYYLNKESEIHVVITRDWEAVSSEPLCSYCCSLLSHVVFT